MFYKTGPWRSSVTGKAVVAILPLPLILDASPGPPQMFGPVLKGDRRRQVHLSYCSWADFWQLRISNEAVGIGPLYSTRAIKLNDELQKLPAVSVHFFMAEICGSVTTSKLEKFRKLWQPRPFFTKPGSVGLGKFRRVWQLEPNSVEETAVHLPVGDALALRHPGDDGHPVAGAGDRHEGVHPVHLEPEYFGVSFWLRLL